MWLFCTAAVPDAPPVHDVALFTVCAFCLAVLLQLWLHVGRKPDGMVPRFYPWLATFLFTFAIGNLLQVSVFPEPFRLAASVAVLLSLGIAIFGFTQLKPFLAALLSIESEPPLPSLLSEKEELLRSAQNQLNSMAGSLKLALEGRDLGSWEWDVTTDEVRVCSTYQKILRLSDANDLKTIHDWQSFIHPNDRTTVSQLLDAFAREEVESFEISYRMTPPNGQIVRVQSSAHHVRNENGAVLAVAGVIIDVTSQQHAKELSRLRDVALSLSQEAVLFLQPNGRIMQANYAATRMLQRTNDQLRDLTIFDIDTSQTPKTWSGRYAVLETGEVFRAATDFLLPDGRSFSSEIQQSLVFVDESQFIALTAVDVSLRKQRERYQRRHEFATERATEAVYWAQEDGRLYYVNQAACRMLGYSRDELLKLRVSDVNPHFPPEQWPSQWEQLQKQGSKSIETTHRTAAGRDLQIGMNLHFYELESEQFVVGTARDITAEKQAKALLSAKTAELENLIRLLPLGLAVVNPDRKFVRVNSEFCRIFGYESSEVVGQRTRILYRDNESYLQAAGYQQQLTDSGEPRRFMIEFRRKDGTILQCETTSTALREKSGEVTGYLSLFQDYTERWETQRSLRRTQQALDMAADAVLWISGDGKIFYANQTAYDRLKYPRPRLEQMTIDEINPTLKSVEDFTKGFWPAIKRDGQLVMESRHRRGDGTEFPVEIVTHLQQFEGEEFTCSFVRDITERHAAKQQLLEAQAKLELALQSGNVSLWEWDAKSNAVSLSDDFHRFIGEAPNSITTLQQWKKRLHPTDVATEDAMMQELITSSNVAYDRTYRIQHRDGSYRWVLSRGRLHRDADGQPERLVGAHVDITDLRNAQLRTESYVSLVGTTDGSWDWAVDSDEVIYSPRFFQLLGLDSESMTDIPETLHFLKEHMHPEDREDFWGKIDRHFRTRNFFDHEARMKMVTGTYRWFRFRAQTIFDEVQRPLRMAGSIYDVTDHKEAELQLRRSNADLEQFAYVASHDLQEPLRAISGFCHLLKLKYTDVLDEQGREYIEHAVQGATRMKGLIEDLLDYARIGRRLEPHNNVSLSECAAEAVKLLETTIHEANAEVRISTLPMLKGCQSLIVQLFQNLLSNAIKFRRPDVVPRIIIQGHTNQREVVVEVIDNGMGMENEYTQQVFQLFQRLHHPENIPGTGLGLAIYQRIVDRHRGTISVSSVPNEGSTFTVRFPQQITDETLVTTNATEQISFWPRGQWETAHSE